MPDSPTFETESAFVCDCEGWMRSACVGEPFYKEHEGKRYCVLHFPGKEKSPDFTRALDRKLKYKDFNFRGVWFPDEAFFRGFLFASAANFGSATFSDQAHFDLATFRAESSFRGATFSDYAQFTSATFSAEADFSSAAFGAEAHFDFVIFRGEADFVSASFKAADFSESLFGGMAGFGQVVFNDPVKFLEVTFGKKADFSQANFKSEVHFARAIFTEAEFSRTTFNSTADFSNATFRDYASYTESKGPKESNEIAFDFQSIRIEKPERFFFPPIKLRPSWFINTDIRKLDLADVEWPDTLDGEVESLVKKGISSPHKPLGATYRRLAISAEENHHYEVASMFRHEAMDMRRGEKWAGLRFWKTDWLYCLYWATSGYGERIRRASLWLVGIWLAFSLLYINLGFSQTEKQAAVNSVAAQRAEIPEPLRLSQALLYSLEVMALQKPEPRPFTNAARSLVLLETILGPVQAALLLLAIRRKFMR